MATHFDCSHGHASMVFPKADWGTHVTMYHPTQADAAAATAARTDTGAPAAGAAAILPPILAADDIFTLLGTTKQAVKAAKPNNMGEPGLMRARDFNYLVQAMRQKFHTGKDTDIPGFIVTLAEHILVSDASEETFKMGTFALVDTTTGDPTTIQWQKLSAFFFDTYMKEMNSSYTPRMLGRFMAPTIYEMVTERGGALEHYNVTKPTWARKYNDHTDWLAASSLFPYMIEPQNWTPGQKALFDAHRSQVTKTGSAISRGAIESIVIDPTNAGGKAMRVSGITAMAQDAIRKGDASKLAQLQALFDI